MGTAPRYACTMDAKDLRDLVRFSEEGPRHEPLFESDHLWSEVVCLQGAQGLGPISDPDSDAICTVVAGRVAVQLDRGRKRLGQWGTVLIPAGSELTIRNASEEPAVIVLIAAPPPTPRAVYE
jgi:quercetin dioxygenase-like cupin family protein